MAGLGIDLEAFEAAVEHRRAREAAIELEGARLAHRNPEELNSDDDDDDYLASSVLDSLDATRHLRTVTGFTYEELQPLLARYVAKSTTHYAKARGPKRRFTPVDEALVYLMWHCMGISITKLAVVLRRTAACCYAAIKRARRVFLELMNEFWFDLPSRPTPLHDIVDSLEPAVFDIDVPNWKSIALLVDLVN
jgi:hypothetical protein